MTTRRHVLQTGAAAAFTLACPAIVHGQVTPDIEINCFLDCSGSMYDAGNHAVQRIGHVNAFRNEGVQNALVGHAVIRLVAWHESAWKLADPLEIREQSDIDRLVGAIEKHTPQNTKATNGYRGTNHAAALDFALQLQPLAFHRVVDISTDQPVVSGYLTSCKTTRNKIEKLGVQINVLAVMLDKAAQTQLRESLCTSDGFLVNVTSWEGYARGITRKLLAELSV